MSLGNFLIEKLVLALSKWKEKASRSNENDRRLKRNKTSILPKKPGISKSLLMKERTITLEITLPTTQQETKASFSCFDSMLLIVKSLPRFYPFYVLSHLYVILTEFDV